MTEAKARYHVRATMPEDFLDIVDLQRRAAPDLPLWSAEQLASHLQVFPEGQFVAVDADSGRVVGMAAGLIVKGEDPGALADWGDVTGVGYFLTHDPANGRTLFGADLLIEPELLDDVIGDMLCNAWQSLASRLGLQRVLVSYPLQGEVVAGMASQAYVDQVVAGMIPDPGLACFQRQGFTVHAVALDGRGQDPERPTYAIFADWQNPDAGKSWQERYGIKLPKPTA